MIHVFVSNSLSFLHDVFSWLVTPVPLTFSVLFFVGFGFRLFRGLLNG